MRRQFGVYYTPQEVIGGFGDVAWDDCFGGATEPLLPKRGGNYFAWPLLTDLWPWQLNGVQWKRTWLIAETREVLEARWKKLVSEPREQRSELMRETDARTVAREI